MITQSTPQRSPLRRLARPAALLGAIATLSAGCDSGARVSAVGGGGINGPFQFLDVDFELRRDLFLSDGFGGDELAGFLGDMRAADIDDDGDVDIVQANFADFDITIAYGDGTGEFVRGVTIRETLDVDGAPLRVVLGDFDGDGDTDIAVAVNDQQFDFESKTAPVNGIHVFSQDENGAFTETAFLALGSKPFDLVAAPISGGPADELLVTLPNENKTLWLGLDGNSLQLIEDLPSFANARFGSPLTVAAADVTGDGLLDVIVGDEKVQDIGGGRVLVHPNLPDVAEGVLLPGVAFGDTGPEVLELPSLLGLQTPLVQNLGDVDGDGLDDVGIADLDGTRLSIFSRDAAGVKVDMVDFGARVLSILAVDLDGDDVKELAATLLLEGAVAVKKGLEPGVYGPQQTLSVGFLPRALQAPDVDGDGVLDLMTCNAQELSLLRGVPGPDFKSAHGYLVRDAADDTKTVQPNAVAAADLDGDGNSDVVAIDLHQREISFLRGDGTGALAHVGSTPLSFSGDESPGYLLLRDFDGDGDVDLVTSVLQTNELAYLRNDGAMPFVITSRIPVGTKPRGLEAGDVDGDGELDLVVANHTDSSVQVCLGDGAGGFDPQPAIDVPAPPLAVALFDVDGDLDLDLAVSTGIGAEKEAFLLVLEGDGAAGFELADQHPLGAQAQVLRCGDLDGNRDGNDLCDIVVSQGGEITDEVMIFRNGTDESGIAFTSQTLTVGLNPGTLILSDVDRDGQLDLLVPLGRGQVRIALGNGEGQFPEFDVLPADFRGLSSPFGTIASAYEDLDGDNLEDLILVSWRTPHVWVARNLSVPGPVGEL